MERLYHGFYSKEEKAELERRLAEEEELTLSMERETQAITADLPETVVSTEEEQPTTAAQLIVGKRRKKKKGKQGNGHQLGLQCRCRTDIVVHAWVDRITRYRSGSGG